MSNLSLNSSSNVTIGDTFGFLLKLVARTANLGVNIVSTVEAGVAPVLRTINEFDERHEITTALSKDNFFGLAAADSAIEFAESKQAIELRAKALDANLEVYNTALLANNELVKRILLQREARNS